MPRRLLHPAPPLESVTSKGVPGTSSAYTLAIGALCSTQDQFEEMWGRMPPPTNNPMNPKTAILRRQCTFGSQSYTFGAQTSVCCGDFASAPALVRRGLEYVQADIRQRFPHLSAADVTVAHCNYYDGGTAALGRHQDVEAQNQGRPIWSITFIASPPGAALYRYFSVFEGKDDKEPLVSFGLRDGDVLVMEGGFQKDLWHSVPRTTRKDTAEQRRINITFRAWG